jgi:phospholipase C
MNKSIVVLAVLGAMLAPVRDARADHDGDGKVPEALRRIKHVVVIYQENHSFDNLYGGWERVDGLDRVRPARATQINQLGAPYMCLLQDDPHLATPPLPSTCTDVTTGATFYSAFANEPFLIDPFIPTVDATRDLVHRFYQEQYQINGGRQNRYVTGSDAVGLSMGHYETTQLPIYQYLHSKGHPRYAIADRFFQASFGGSFLNHQWLVAARTPVFAGALDDGSPNDLHSVVDDSGMPNNYPLYASPLGKAVLDKSLTASCSPAPGRPATPQGVVCGDYAVNTTQPISQPYQPGTPAARRLPLLDTANIGDALSANGVDWAWYSGGWSNAAGNVNEPGWTNGAGPACADPATIGGAAYPNCPDALFQFHHQAFNYYSTYKPGTAARQKHLRDEEEFLQVARASSRDCGLKAVSFIKPIGRENEHPGYANESAGNQHLVDLLKAIEGSACAGDTMVITTYDEFGGFWDHVSPPGQGRDDDDRGDDDRDVADAWGPGTRIPALILAPGLDDEFVVDHVAHDTTSILATIERRFGIAPLADRDAAVRDLSSVFHGR